MKYVIYVLIICALLYVVQFGLFYYKYTDYKPAVFAIVMMYFLFFVLDTGSDLKTHGAYNRVIVLLFIPLLILLIGFFMTFYYCLVKRTILTIIVTIILVGLIYVKIEGMISGSCAGWEDGFKGTKILNPKESRCKIVPPKICYYQILNGVVDLSRLLGDTYENMGANKLSMMTPHITDPTSRILGYPRTEGFPMFPDSMEGKLQKSVFKNILNMENPKLDEKLKAKIE